MLEGRRLHPTTLRAQEPSCAGIVMPQGDGSDNAKTCWLRRTSMTIVASVLRPVRCTTRFCSLLTGAPGRNVRKSKCTPGAACCPFACALGSAWDFWARPGANIDGTEPLGSYTSQPVFQVPVRKRPRAALAMTAGRSWTRTTRARWWQLVPCPHAGAEAAA